MRHLLGTCIVWLSIAAMAAGLVGFGALSFLYGPDTGGPTNMLAGLIMLRWVLQTPVGVDVLRTVHPRRARTCWRVNPRQEANLPGRLRRKRR